jgi:CspA family cold shock protein
MKEGVVKNVSDRGFGFISVEGSDKDVYYHEKTLTGDLAERKLKVGDKVTFEVEQTERGLNAKNIKLVE